MTHEQEPQDSTLTNLVLQLPRNQDIFCIRDPCSGYNVLQQAVISRRKEVVILLLQRVGCSSHSNSKCSPPVHIAAYLGLDGVLELLLRHGGNCVEISGMCFPERHSPLRYDKWIGIFDSPRYACQKNVQTPIYTAIDQDNLVCVKILMNHMTETGVHLPSPTNLIHAACFKGSVRCLEYFIHKYPNDVNSHSANHDSPLLTAVVWGRNCVRVLLENGADPRQVSKLGETALHRLYKYDRDGIFTLYDTTKYLLTNGVEQSINEINLMNETPLHVLVTHVSYIGGDIIHTDDTGAKVVRSELQQNYQEQVIQTLDILLKFNADPSLINRHNLSPLNKLLHIAYKSYDNSDTCVKTSIDSQFVYKNDFNYLKQAVEVLLHNGADPNAQCDLGHTPFILLLQCLLKMDVIQMCSQEECIVGLAEVLLNHGAKCNFYGSESEQGTCSTLMANIASRYFKIHQLNSQTCVDLQSSYCRIINRLLKILLQHGMEPNFITTKKALPLKGGCGNAIIDFVRLGEHVTCTADFAIIKQWLVTLFQWGADPDQEPYPSEPIICHSQSSIFLKHQATQPLSHCLYEVKDSDSLFDDGHAQNLLLLFYFTMSHKQLYACLNTAQFMARFHPQGATGRDFLKLLTCLCESPRSLKEMSRVAIYKSLSRQLALKVPELPLPNVLKSYLLEIQ